MNLTLDEDKCRDDEQWLTELLNELRTTVSHEFGHALRNYDPHLSNPELHRTGIDYLPPADEHDKAI